MSTTRTCTGIADTGIVRPYVPCVPGVGESSTGPAATPKGSRRRGIVGTAALLVCGLVWGSTGCDDGIEAGQLEPAGGSAPTAAATSTAPTAEATATAEPTATPTDEPTEEEVALNVCELVPAKRVRAIFGRDKTPTMDQPERAEPGVPGVGTVYRCTYRFEPGETTQFVTIAAMTETGETEPEAYVANVLGDGFTPVDGFGDAAGSIRQARFGNGIGAFAQARRTETGVSGVFVQGPEASTDEQFGQLADEFFTALATYERAGR